MTEENGAKHPDPLGLNGVLNDESLISSSDTTEILKDILTEKRYYVYQNPYTNNMEALIPCVNNEAEILKDLPKVDGQPVPYKIVDQLPQKYFESYDLCCTAACPDILEVIQSRAKLHSLKKSEWRQSRTIQFSKYDVSFMRALEDGNSIEIDRIKSIKQQLRDVTAADVSSLTNQELEDFTPDILKQ